MLLNAPATKLISRENEDGSLKFLESHIAQKESYII
jgi:hypothetical protein